VDPTSPFDDPDVQAALAKAGVVHRPGLADEMMDELAPLLAEEGIDLDDPESVPDLDQLNAALAYATERRNMELSTPVGAERSRTLATLRDVSDAVHGGEVNQAESILEAIGPDPTSGRPSAAQLIGTSLDLLDSWHSQDPTRAALAGVSAQRWMGRGRAAARDVLALARKGRARASMDRLIRNHRGLALAHGGALLVAASLRALAEHERRDYAQMADAYLSETSPAGEPDRPGGPGQSVPPIRQTAASGSALGRAAFATVSSRNAIRGFRRWLQGGASADPGAIEVEAAALETLLDQATAEGIDPYRAEQFDLVLDLVDEYFPPHQLEAMYQLLHDYVDFRMETEPSAEGWDEAHDLISEVLYGDDVGASAVLLAAFRETQALDDGQRRAALADLPLIAASRLLLDWIGASRPITQAGAPRRADIGTVAAMIGVDAEGVARRPEHTDWDAGARELGGSVGERRRVYVQSAKEIPELAAWWAALEDAGVIELTPTRVRPGPQADSLTVGGEFSLEVAEELMASYVAGILTGPLHAGSAPFGSAIVVQTMARLLEALVPETVREGGEVPSLLELFELRARQELRRLEVAGLLEFADESDGSGEISVPLALRGPVVLGAMMAADTLESE
jgi:hypothetical protein